jgi:deoxyribodipyrimidine photo-lyase
MNVLVWFKRDLRIHDHAALAMAAEIGPVLPLYMIEPPYWQLPDTSARQWEFTAEALQDLRAALGAIGAPLILRTGDAVDILARFCRDHQISRIISHAETGNLWTYARDRRVAAWARANGVLWTELPQSGVVRRLTSRDGWARLRDAHVAGAQIAPPPALRAIAGIEPGLIPGARALRLSPDPCPHRQTGGRDVALATLASFLDTRGAPYRAAMSSPLSGERACSRLSPYLAAGCLSVREVAQATTARQSERPGGAWGGSLRSFQSRLAWRDHFTQKLEDQPSIETRCLHPATEGLRPRDATSTRLGAWAAGQTGLPFLDACMRYLAATGWLNFRMRAMVMSAASYHLWLDWRDTGPVLARLFTDYDPGIHWPQVQMQSGTTGINTPRIYNPVKQGQDQDPTGAFTRRWVPELGPVPPAFLQEPWKWNNAHEILGSRYPDPIIDVASAARFARETIWGQRRAPAFRPAADAIVQKHASRKDSTSATSGPRFVRDPMPKPSTQTSFDF